MIGGLRRSLPVLMRPKIGNPNPLKSAVCVGNTLMFRRNMSSLLLEVDDDLDRWPKTKPNTVLNICPQGYMMVVERLGKLSSIQGGGWFLAVPGVDSIRYVIDMREKALSISPQSAITKDNVHVHVSGNLYCQFVDAERAAYGSKNPLYAVKQQAQSAMRAAIGEMELDEILHARAKLNTYIRESVQGSAQAWGLEIKRYEITEVSPDKVITEAMDKQAAAERNRRKKVLDAEGDKKSQELESEGMKIRLSNESEGMLIKITNEGEAKKREIILLAEGEAASIVAKAKAQAEGIRLLANALSDPHSAEAAKLAVAKEVSFYSILFYLYTIRLMRNKLLFYLFYYSTFKYTNQWPNRVIL